MDDYRVGITQFHLRSSPHPALPHVTFLCPYTECCIENYMVGMNCPGVCFWMAGSCLRVENEGVGGGCVRKELFDIGGYELGK